MTTKSETPELGELTGYIGHDLAETFKDEGIEVETWETIGEIELKFPDGKSYRIEITEESA